MGEQRKIDFKKRGAMFFCLALFYLAILFVLQMAFTGDSVWLDEIICIMYGAFLFAMIPTMIPTHYAPSWRFSVGYAIGFFLYLCLNLSIYPWQLCDEIVVDSSFIRLTVYYGIIFYVVAWLLGLLGKSVKNTILRWLFYVLAAIVCVVGLWHTLTHWYIWVTRFFLWYIYMPDRCFF